MGRCVLCGKSSPYISQALSLCLSCIRGKDEALHLAMEAHGRREKRGAFRCSVCVNGCSLSPGERGFCGVRVCKGFGVSKISGRGAFLDWYYDPLPTNCVAEWVCGERGPGSNLAVFFGGCSFNCLFCQNWHHRSLVGRDEYIVYPEDLASLIKEDVKCVCFFGGDPSPYMDFVVNTSKLLVERGVRVCLETNGSMSWGLLKSFLVYSKESRGITKFDLKAMDERLHMALTGSSNRNTLRNIENALEERADIVVSTLLVPGYIDREEVYRIAKFIASLSRDIPYSLLAFHPQHLMRDLPPTPRSLAMECVEAAREAGLRNVHVGNVHLLW